MKDLENIFYCCFGCDPPKDFEEGIMKLFDGTTIGGAKWIIYELATSVNLEETTIPGKENL